MGETKNFARGKAEFREPFRPRPVIIDSGKEERRPGLPGASPEEEARHEAHVPPDPTSLSVHPASPRRKPRRDPETYSMEVVRLRDVPPNPENPYTSLSPGERHECLMRRLSAMWGAICKREDLSREGQGERRKAA